MQFFTRLVRSRRGSLATQAAIAFGAALGLPDVREAHAAGVPEAGVWINNEGKGAIEIKPCGAALCGNIVWLKNPVNDQGKPLSDRLNPDETKRNRPICGLPVIGNVKRTPEGWDEGWIYNPEEGAQYDVALQAAGDRLTVTGYKGIKLFSKTFTWTRAPADLQRCDGAGPQQTKAKPVVAPPKLAAPAPQDGAAPTAVKKQATGGPAPAAAVKATAKPAAALTAAKKPPAKDAKAGPPAATGAPAKTPGTAKTTTADKQGVAPAKKAVAAKPTQPGTAAAKKAVATAPGTKPPAKAAAKPAAKKPATATASAVGDEKATVPSDKKPAAKPAAKKETADEDDAPSAVP